MAAGGSGSARPSGSSGPTARAIRPAASTGASRRAPTQLFLRDQEWEAAESVWLWADSSASMVYQSASTWSTKADRALLLLLALGSLLTRAGERIALLGRRRRPTGGRVGMATLCEDLLARSARRPAWPRSSPCRGSPAWS